MAATNFPPWGVTRDIRGRDDYRDGWGGSLPSRAFGLPRVHFLDSAHYVVFIALAVSAALAWMRSLGKKWAPAWLVAVLSAYAAAIAAICVWFYASGGATQMSRPRPWRPGRARARSPVWPSAWWRWS